jgi:cyanophycinase
MPRAAGNSKESSKGTVILIGGAEDKTGERAILAEIARRVGAGPLVVCTAGSAMPDELWWVYKEVFQSLGVRSIAHVDIRQREDADEPSSARAMKGAQALFFTGGDQLRITSNISGSKLYLMIEELYRKGGTVAGTSAGASALGHTMPVSPERDEHKVAAASRLVPGLGLLQDVIVDQHFAQRGRMGRLVAAVAENPRLLGVGIDENTALVHTNGIFHVIGSGTVYVVDGRELTRTNIAEPRTQTAVSAFDLRLHVLKEGNGFDVTARRPVGHSHRIPL